MSLQDEHGICAHCMVASIALNHAISRGWPHHTTEDTWSVVIYGWLCSMSLTTSAFPLATASLGLASSPIAPVFLAIFANFCCSLPLKFPGSHMSLYRHGKNKWTKCCCYGVEALQCQLEDVSIAEDADCLFKIKGTFIKTHCDVLLGSRCLRSREWIAN